MHIQENKVNNKVSRDAASPKHSFAGKRNYQAKHAQEVPKKRNRGIAEFVVSFVLLAALLVLRRYAVCFVPAALTMMVLSICAVVKRGTFFSVTAVVISALTLMLTAAFAVFAVVEFLTGSSMTSVFAFTVFS